MTEQKKNDFWGEEETKPKKPEEKRIREDENRKFDLKWIIFGLSALFLLIVGAVLINANLGSETTSEQIAGAVDVDNGDKKINWERYGTYDVELSETYTITAPGTYHFTGELTDGAIIVNSMGSAVRLILDNVTIKNASGPAIACYAAEDLVIELVGTNSLSDGASYSANYDEDVLGAIYSKSDLSFQGDGTLNLIANYQDGIVSKDDLKFNSGKYHIVAADDGIRGKDSVYIVDGDFQISATGDGIKSTNETDTGKGFVLIENGTFEIFATGKGIKAITTIMLYDGTYNLTTKDDSIHSNGYISIVGGNIKISSGDDGVHADREIVMDGGKINILKSYEGIESQKVVVNGGEISLVASDDGFNAGGGADSSAVGRPGANAFDADENCALIFNGGKVYVNSSGDGIDSNGMVYFNGAEVVVDGPTSSGDGALDSGLSIEMAGGSVIAVGSSGMAETLGSNSSVYNIATFLSSNQAAGTVITIKDTAGETILSHTAKKTFSSIIAGTEAFKFGESYTIYLNDTKYQTFTISDITTTIGNGNANFNNGMMNGGTRR